MLCKFSAFLLPIILFLSLNSSNSATVSLPGNGRIINGNEETETSEYAVEVISLLNLELQTWGGGTLIREDVVLTQAFLIDRFTNIMVRFGSVNWGNLHEMNVIEAVAHPEYDPADHSSDIGLLRLEGSVLEVAPEMRPALFRQPPSGDNWLFGSIKSFGLTSIIPEIHSILLTSMVQQRIDDEECRELLGPRGSVLTDFHFCAIDKMNGASACNFDNGSGFVVIENGVSYVRGVLSMFTNMCQPQFPAMYTATSLFEDWVDETMSIFDSAKEENRGAIEINKIVSASLR